MRLKKFYLSLPIVCLLIASLTGCGFKLRGEFQLPTQLRVMYLKTHKPYSALSKQLNQTLQSIGIKLVSSSQEAPYTLEIINDTLSHTTTSISATTQVVQYILTYTVNYRVLDKQGKEVLSPRSIVATRNYTANRNRMLGGSIEQSLLEEDMRRDVVSQLLNQLSTLLK